MSVAWDVFAASLDPVQLDQERMRVTGDLADERPMGFVHDAMVAEHSARARGWHGYWGFRDRLEALEAKLEAYGWESLPEEVAPSRQSEIAMQALMNAEPATSGPVSHSERVTPASAGENTSAKVNPATGHVAAKVSTNQGKPVTTERKAA